ncbi:hypothetical protein AM1_B0225 (plasmid) [Acaryochloris marina MBIC11017]|uniref:Uncharacterized protein n=1 Tax=Acaryochloris marina (strain MBIC 11017) TaxID=329726 RepID=A8ZLB8_ACAM1|nr:hypothetical protein AM1_B0225 [Acaryochloris marina MBIC11017]
MFISTSFYDIICCLLGKFFCYYWNAPMQNIFKKIEYRKIIFPDMSFKQNY